MDHSERDLPSRVEWLTFERLTTALLFLVIAVGACFAPAQSDTWWQLRTGQEIWNTGTVDLRDHFSHTIGGGVWPNREWLSQVLFYAVYREGGLRALTAFAAIVVVGAWLLIWRMTPGDNSRRFTLSVLALVPSSLAWALRPQVLTLFFIAATAFLVARRRYPLLPLLFVVWANLDGGVMLGFVILAGGTVAEFLEDREWPVPIAVAIVGCFAATMITPLGVSIWTDIPASLARLRAYGVTEWRPPDYADPMLLPFWLLAVYLLWLVVRDRPWRSASVRSDSNLWAALAMLPFAVNSGRHVPAFLLLAVPAIAAIRPTSRVAFSRKPSARKVPRLERPVLNTGIFAAAAVLAGFTVTYAWVSQTARLGWHPLSQRAIVALRSCPGPLYNRYDDGGYVIWFVPDRKVFLDSRQDPYPPALVNEQIRVETSGNYQQLFRRFAIRCVLAPPESVISQRLVADGWQHAYRGRTFVVLYSSGTLQVPRKFGFKIGNEL